MIIETIVTTVAADGAHDDLGRPVWGIPDDERVPFVPPPVEQVR